MDNNSIIKCTFDSKMFGEIRVVYDDGEVYFSERDVGFALGFKEPTKWVGKYCKNIHHYRHETPGGMQYMNFIDYMDVIHLYNHSKCDNANDFLAYLARICITLKDADLHLPDFLADEEYYEDEYCDEDYSDNGYDESDCDDDSEDYDSDEEYNYCEECDFADECDCYKGRIENEGETETYKPNLFDLGEVLNEISAFVRSFEEKYGVLIAIEGIYHECGDDRHRVA